MDATTAEIIRLRDEDDCTFAEIGRRLGLHEEACRGRYRRVKAREEPPELPPAPKSAPKPELQAEDLLPHLRQRVTFDELCETLDRSPGTVKRLLSELQAAGYQILNGGDTYQLTKTAGRADTLVDHQVQTTRRTFAVIGDTHLCSKQQQLTHLRHFYEVCAERGIDTVYHVGDILDGEGLYRGHEHSVFVHGHDDQIAYTVAHYPRIDGITTHLIGGNHDLVYIKRAGADPCRPIAQERADIVYHGPYSAWIQLADDALMYLLHPDGGGAYAHSYKLQKIIESFEGGKKPRLTFVGHWHQWNHVKARNVDGWLTGCFQAQTEYERRKALQPVIGGNIITVEFDDEGLIRHVAPEFYQYMVPIERDYA